MHLLPARRNSARRRRPRARQGLRAPEAPNLITNVATTDATVTDNQMTGPSTTTWPGSLAPGRHYPDSGYPQRRPRGLRARQRGIALVGPLLADTSAQARAGTATPAPTSPSTTTPRPSPAPRARRQRILAPCTQRGKDAIVATFSALDCGPCPARELCTTSGKKRRQLTMLPRAWPKPRPPPATAEKRSFQADYARRAGVEAPCTKRPATARAAPATAACPRPDSTTCTWPAALNLSACEAYWTGTPTGPATNQPPRHASNSASPHEPNWPPGSPIGASQPITSSWYWALLGFDLAMRVRNAVWRPPFVMYYRTCPLHAAATT